MAGEEVSVRISLRDGVTASLRKVDAGIKGFATRSTTALKRLSSVVFSLKGALIGMGAGMIAKSFIQAGAQAETFRTQILAVMDQNKALADSTLKWVREFAALAPTTTQDVVQAFIRLKAVGVNVDRQMLTTIGNVAYIFDKTEEKMSNLATALVSLEAEPLKRLGVILKQDGKIATITFDGMTYQVEKNADAIRTKLLELWDKKFPDAMKNAEKDWSGKMALMKSQWWEFQVKVMESGVFNWLKAGLDQISGSFGNMDATAKATADLVIEAFKTIATAGGYLGTALNVVKGAFWMLAAAGAMAARHIAGAYAAVLDTFQIGLDKLSGLAKKYSDFVKMLPKGTLGPLEILNPVVKSIEKNSEQIARTLGKTTETLDDFAEDAEKIMNEAADSILALSDPTIMKPHERVALLIANVESAVRAKAAADKEAAAAAEEHARSVENQVGPLQDMSDTLENSLNSLYDMLYAAQGFADLGPILEGKFGKPLKDINDLGKDIATTFGDNIYSSIEDAIEGTFEWQKALKDVAKDMGRMAFQFAMKSAMNYAFGEEGGVFPAFTKRMPIKGYARGGITRGPELAIIGEGRKNEAVVPLDSGEKIPVEVRNGQMGGDTINVTIQAMDGTDVERVLSSNRDSLMRAFARALRDNPSLMRQ